MTPDSVLEAAVRELEASEARVRRARPSCEAAARPARIVREAAALRGTAAVVGLGHAGLPSALALRRAGMRVLGIDTSPSRLREIRGARADLLDVRAEELRARLADEDFVLGEEIEQAREADWVLICVPAVLDAVRAPSLEALRRACAAVVECAHEGQTLVLASASHVGATRELLVEPLARRGLRAGEEVHVACSPARIDAGVAEHDQLLTPRVVGAIGDACYERAARLLAPISRRLHRVSSPEAAEMAKLYESAFRAVNVALAFEMADACRAQRLDPAEVTAAAASKPFGFLAHRPSAGVGGHAVGVDPYCLLSPLRERGRDSPVLEGAMHTIAARPGLVAMRAHELLLRSGGRLRDARVLVVGAAYKPGVADCTGSPAVEIISWLAAEDVRVDYHDPLVPVLHVDGEDMFAVDPDPRRDASGFGPEDYELAIVLTIQPGYDYGWLRRCPQVLDCTYGEPVGRAYELP